MFFFVVYQILRFAQNDNERTLRMTIASLRMTGRIILYGATLLETAL